VRGRKEQREHTCIQSFSRQREAHSPHQQEKNTVPTNQQTEVHSTPTSGKKYSSPQPAGRMLPCGEGGETAERKSEETRQRGCSRVKGRKDAAERMLACVMEERQTEEDARLVCEERQ
jgi:hypothetical protein